LRFPCQFPDTAGKDNPIMMGFLFFTGLLHHANCFRNWFRLLLII
jgi:hypothetical protein